MAPCDLSLPRRLVMTACLARGKRGSKAGASKGWTGQADVTKVNQDGWAPGVPYRGDKDCLLGQSVVMFGSIVTFGRHQFGHDGWQRRGRSTD